MSEEQVEKPRLKWSPPVRQVMDNPQFERNICNLMWMLRHKLDNFSMLIPDTEVENFNKTLAYWDQEPSLEIVRVPTGTKGGRVVRKRPGHPDVITETPIVEIVPHSTVVQMIDKRTGVHITPGTPEDGPELWKRKELDECLDMVEGLVRGGAMQAGQRVFSSGETADMVRCLLVFRDHIRGK